MRSQVAQRVSADGVDTVPSPGGDLGGYPPKQSSKLPKLKLETL